jgi:hypothetical protein
MLDSSTLQEARQLCDVATAAALMERPEWRRVDEFPGYCVDADGRIWSVFFRWRGRCPHGLTPVTDGYGYHKVRFALLGGGRRKVSVHRVVCRAFHGEPPAGREQVRHLDGNKTNNRADNLAWGSAAENGADKVALGECAMGSDNGASVLTEWEVMIVKELAARGFEARELSRLFGVNKSTVVAILAGERWKHVAAARDALPALLAEVGRLRRHLARLSQSVHSYDDVAEAGHAR